MDDGRLFRDALVLLVTNQPVSMLPVLRGPDEDPGLEPVVLGLLGAVVRVLLGEDLPEPHVAEDCQEMVLRGIQWMDFPIRSDCDVVLGHA